MSYNTIIEQGSFVVASGVPTKTIACRIDPDWVEVFNYTEYGATSANAGIKYYWQKGMPNGAALVESHNSSTTIISGLFTAGGIYIYNTGTQDPEAAKTLSGTEITNADPAVATSTSHGYVVNDIVRLYGTTGMLQIAGMDFTITAVDTNSFTLGYLDASGFYSAAIAGFARRINDVMFYPRNRYITKFSATSGSSTDVDIVTSVTHGYQVGQVILLNMPTIYGSAVSTSFDGEYGTVVSTTAATNLMTVRFSSNADASSFVFPVASASGFQFAQVLPSGESMKVAVALNGPILGDASYNQAAINLVLGTGNGTISGPAGKTADNVMYWKAGRSFSNN